MAELADYRVFFATIGTPPRKLSNVRPFDDPDLPEWLVYVDGQDREVCRVNRDVVLFAERLDRDHAAAEVDGGEIREAGRAGVAKVAAAIRPPKAVGLPAVRDSIRPTYDSRRTGPRYHVTSRVAGRTIEFEKRVDDPFVRQTVHVGWPDLLRGLLRRRLAVEVIVGGDLDVVNDVLELDANQLVPGSTRQAAFRSHLNEAIGQTGQTGLDRVAEAVRRSRGGPPPPQIQGYA